MLPRDPSQHRETTKQQYDLQAGEGKLKYRTGLLSAVASAGLVDLTEAVCRVVGRTWPQLLVLLISLVVARLVSREMSQRLAIFEDHEHY